MILSTDNKPKYYLENYKKCLSNAEKGESLCNKPFYLADRENRICSQTEQNSFIYDNQECVRVCPYGIKEDNACADDNGDNSQVNCLGSYLQFNLLILFFGVLFFLS